MVRCVRSGGAAILALGCFFCLSALAVSFCTRPARGDESSGAVENANSAPSFSSTSLLAQYDKDRDGELSGAEGEAVRAAFGGIDVPLLPSPAANYSDTELPAHFAKAGVDKLDNTPADNPLTDEGATLGRVLFYDRQLSRNDTIACASCHLQESAFADPRQFSVGFLGGHTKRNAMGFANLRYTRLQKGASGFFWDERAATLEDQALMPIQDPVEMGMDLEQLEVKLSGLPYYPSLFEKAFNSPDVTHARISKAIAQFVRSIISCNSRFDEAAARAADLRDDFEGWTEQENLGKRLFFEGVDGLDEFACAMCHEPPTFHMRTAMNIGLEMKYADAGLGLLDRPSNDPFTPSNEGKFRAPSLRNIALTAPYMHDGRFKTLPDVLSHYSEGVHPHPNLGLAFRPGEEEKATLGFRFAAEQKEALIAFLQTLTDEQLTNDSRFSDPFIRAAQDDSTPTRASLGHDND